MSNVYCMWSGEPIGPATLEMLESNARSAKHAADIELVRQVDELVEAYRFAWDPLGRYDCDELLAEHTVSPSVEGLPNAP